MRVLKEQKSWASRQAAVWPAGWVSDESGKGVAQKRTTVKRTRGHELSPKS